MKYYVKFPFEQHMLIAHIKTDQKAETHKITDFL